MRLPNGDFSEYDMECIRPELEKLKSGEVYLEVGVKYGKSLAFAKQTVQEGVIVCGIDIENTNEFKDAIFINGSSNDVAKIWRKKISLLFIDGDHSYRGCLDDWINFSHLVKRNGFVFFHDCDETSPGVVQVANEVAGKNGWGKLKIYKKPGFNTSMASVRRLK